LWASAQANAKRDEANQAYWYWDANSTVFWTWDTPRDISNKFAQIVAAKRLGGVMAWSLGEDSAGWSHMLAVQKGVRALEDGGPGHSGSGSGTTSRAGPAATKAASS